MLRLAPLKEVAVVMDESEPTPPLFFIHVMKTGGTSLWWAFQSLYAAELRYPTRAEGTGVRGNEKIFVHALLDLPAQQRARYRCFSVHLPAWLAAEVAPGHLTMSVLREPVERTMSHLRHIARIDGSPQDLVEIYDDPGWRACLSNYQTRWFSESKQDYERDLAAGQDYFATTDPAEAIETLEDGYRLIWSTGIANPKTMTEHDLARAVKRVESLDIIGTTDRLDLVTARLRHVLGRPLQPLQRLNESPVAQTGPDDFDDLRRRIREDTLLDAALYERAREVADDQAS